jgi:peptidoglycan/LPS O-acetylase OafA/YrhL
MLPVAGRGEHLSGTPGFFRRRAVRILPPYYAALACSVAVILATGQGNSLSFASIAQHALLVHDFTTHMLEINGPMWSIAVEVQIYLFFPLLLWLMRRTNIYTVLVSTGVVGYSVFAYYGLWNGLERDTHYIFIFALGMYAAWFVSREGRRDAFVPACLGLLFSLVTVLFAQYWGIANFQWTDLFVGVAACCALITGATNEHGFLARFFSQKYLLSIGAFSYSLYLMHKPVQMVVNWWIEDHQIGLDVAFLIRAVLGTVLALVISYAFYLVFEKPFLRRTPKGAVTVANAG